MQLTRAPALAARAARPCAAPPAQCVAQGRRCRRGQRATLVIKASADMMMPEELPSDSSGPLGARAAVVLDPPSQQSQQQLLEEQQRRSEYVLEETKSFLAADLQRLFDTGNITTPRYAPNIVFQDPVTTASNLDGYLFMIRALRSLFNIDFQLHSIDTSGPCDVTARWTMTMQLWVLPWKPTLAFSGRSIYKVDVDKGGLILSQTDTWDAITNNEYLSVEGVVHVLQQLLQVQLTPSLEGPSYSLLKVARDYEIRRYSPFLVAEAPMSPGSGPAGGSGFTELASYIFGSNTQSVKMEMTTPVLSTGGASAGAGSSTMQFVMEPRFSDPSQLPTPNDTRISVKQQEGGYFAAVRFSGWPLDFEVVQAERGLRSALLRDGLNPAPGYSLARYNEPTVPPFLRRNEVLIQLPGFEWP